MAILAVLMATMMIFTGCSTKTDDNSTDKTEVKDSNKKTADSSTDEGKKLQSLVVYSNSAGDGRGEWLTEQAKGAGFDISIVQGGGGDIANRLLAEKNNPIADVVYGLSTLDYESFKKEDLLLNYVPKWAEEVSEGLSDPEGYYHAIVTQAILLIYNLDTYDDTTAPKDWPDLWKNEMYSGKYNVFGLGGGTSKAVLSGIITRYADPNGEYGISEEGWEEVKKYIQNAHMHVEGDDWFGNVVDGSLPMAMIWSSGVNQFQKEHNAKVGVMTPEIGVPFVVEHVAVINGTKNEAAAKAFVDWFGSAQMQGAWTEQFATAPANKIAMERASDETKELANSVTVQQIDWKFVSNNINDWVEKIELEMME